MIQLSTADSLIIKIPIIHKAYVFAHGNYQTNNEGTFHYTYINKKRIKTQTLLEELKDYNVWISMCQQGNSEYVSQYNNSTQVLWPQNVDRITQPGSVLNLYNGIGITRIPIRG